MLHEQFDWNGEWHAEADDELNYRRSLKMPYSDNKGAPHKSNEELFLKLSMKEKKRKLFDKILNKIK